MTRRPASALAVQLAAHLVAALSLPQLQLQRGSGERPDVLSVICVFVTAEPKPRKPSSCWSACSQKRGCGVCRRHAGGVRGGGGAAGAAARARQRAAVAARGRHPGRAAAPLGALDQHRSERPARFCIVRRHMMQRRRLLRCFAAVLDVIRGDTLHVWKSADGRMCVDVLQLAALLAALPFEAGLRVQWAAHALHWALSATSPHLASRSHQVTVWPHEAASFPPAIAARPCLLPRVAPLVWRHQGVVFAVCQCEDACHATAMWIRRHPNQASPRQVVIICPHPQPYAQVYRALRPALEQGACARLLGALEALLRPANPPPADLLVAVEIIVTLGVRTTANSHTPCCQLRSMNCPAAHCPRLQTS
jgi:Cell morphogenesis central region